MPYNIFATSSRHEINDYLRFFSLVPLLISYAQTAADKEVAALIARVTPNHAQFFKVDTSLPQQDGKDIFQVSDTEDGKILIRGNNGVSVASGYHWCLKNRTHCHLSWCGDQLKLPKALVIGWEKSLILEQISLRISGYLRMINTREAQQLASQFDKNDPAFSCKPIQPFVGTWKDNKSDLNIRILADGSVSSSADQSGTWRFSGDALHIPWKDGGSITLSLYVTQLQADLTSSEQQGITKKLFQRVSPEK